jgi:flagellar biosynthesis/type III secretory pathway chaperone
MANAGETLAELLSELHATLEEERRVLLSGRPAPIAEIAERKLRLAERIEAASGLAGAGSPDAQTMVALDRYNRGNAVICAAMLRHLTRTLDRLRQCDCHRSYGPDGAERGPATQGRLGAA